LKIVIALAILALVLCVYFFYQGNRSAAYAPPSLSGNELAVCGSKPNCVSSVQDTSDEHYIVPIELASVATEERAASVVAAIESLGVEPIENALSDFGRCFPDRFMFYAFRSPVKNYQ